jgi:hypothetical protein
MAAGRRVLAQNPPRGQTRQSLMRTLTPLRHAPFTSAIILASLLSSAGASARGQNPHSALKDIRFLNIMLPEEAEKWYTDNYGNLQHPVKAWRIADVYSNPDSCSKILGYIWLVAQWISENEPRLAFRMEYESADSHDRLLWMNDKRISDWGYGINQFVLDVLGNWCHLPQGPFPPHAWINVVQQGTGRLSGSSHSVVNELVLSFDSLAATNVRTKKEEFLYGNFMITQIAAHSIVCRPEIPSDMPCGDDNPVDPPKDAVPFYRIDSKAIIEEMIQLKVSTAYPKGC